MSRIRYVVRVERGQPQPTVSLAVLSPTIELRELTSLTDQTIVKAPRERSRRRPRRRQRPGDAADPDPDQAARALQRARHRRRSGHQRDPQREPGRAGRAPHAAARMTRSCASRARSRIRRSSRASSSRQQGGGPVYLSQVADVIDGEKEQDSISRDQRTAVDHARRLQGAGRQHRRDRRGDQAPRSKELKSRLPPDVELRLVNSQAD